MNKVKNNPEEPKAAPMYQNYVRLVGFLGKDPENINRIAADIRSKYPGQETVYLRADRETQFDIIAQVMSVLGNAKIGIAVVTQPDGSVGKR